MFIYNTGNGGNNMKHIKKTVMITMLLALFIGTLGFEALTVKETNAGEREEIESGDWRYKLLEDGTAELTAYYGEKVDVVIPAEVDGKKVTKLGGYGVFARCSSLKSIVIPDGVTEIGDNTFYECTALETINIPNGVREIGEYAFYYCTSLAKVNIPDSVIKIGELAFNESGLKELTGGKGLQEIGEYAFSDTDWIRNQNKIKENGIWYCSFGNIQIKCSSLADFAKEISFEPEGADWSTYRRSYVELPDGTVMLWSGAIYDLSPINGKKISHISSGAFGDFESWRAELNEKDMVIPDGIEYIGRRIGGFVEDRINSIVFPTSLKYIDNLAYAGGNTYIYAGLYNGGGSITSITLNEGLVKIGKGAFWGHNKLKSVIIPPSVKEIGKYAFGYCGVDLIGPSEKLFDGASKGFTKIPDFTIYGYPGTAAETYAKENGFKFISLENEKTDCLISIVPSGDFSPKLEMSKEELLSAVASYISAEQLSSVEAGKMPLDLRIMVKAIDDSVSEDDKALITQALTELPDSAKLNYKVFKYLDIKLSAVIDGEELVVSETDGAVMVSVALEKPANENYKIVRIHNGRAEVIDARLSEDGTKLSFETDKFSIYAIVYSDLASGGEAPKTLIAAFMLAGLAVMAAGVLVMIKAFRASEN